MTQVEIGRRNIAQKARRKKSADVSHAQTIGDKAIIVSKTPSINHPFLGSIDNANNNIIDGWVFNKNDPNIHPIIEVWLGSNYVGTTYPSKIRPDVDKYVGHEGVTGFQFDIKSSAFEEMVEKTIQKTDFGNGEKGNIDKNIKISLRIKMERNSNNYFHLPLPSAFPQSNLINYWYEKFSQSASLKVRPKMIDPKLEIIGETKIAIESLDNRKTNNFVNNSAYEHLKFQIMIDIKKYEIETLSLDVFDTLLLMDDVCEARRFLRNIGMHKERVFKKFASYSD